MNNVQELTIGLLVINLIVNVINFIGILHGGF